MSRQTGAILAEVGFLLILFAGVWLVAAQIPAFKILTERNIVAGIALALGGINAARGAMRGFSLYAFQWATYRLLFFSVKNTIPRSSTSTSST